jgi:hypothetical protein
MLVNKGKKKGRSVGAPVRCAGDLNNVFVVLSARKLNPKLHIVAWDLAPVVSELASLNCDSAIRRSEPRSRPLATEAFYLLCNPFPRLPASVEAKAPGGLSYRAGARPGFSRGARSARTGWAWAETGTTGGNGSEQR